MHGPITTSEPIRDATRPRPRNARSAILSAGALALLLCVTAIAGAAPVPPSANHPGPMVAASSAGSVFTGSWAWGAAANLSLRYDFAGAYNQSSSIGGGNLTENGTYVSLQEGAAIGYAVYVVVTAQSGPNGTLAVTVRTAEYAAEQFELAASGTFPAAGTYNASTPIHLVPMNISVSASVASLTSVSGFMNYSTGPNGTVALVNEHLDVLKGVALSLTANNFPNVTRDGSGNTVLKYVSGSMAEDAWMAVNFSAAFSPSFALVRGPVQVGESWFANSTATVNGTVAYAAQYAASVPGGPTGRWSQSGSAQLSTTAAISMECTVTGTQVVRSPDGTPETDYVIQYTVAPGSSNWTVADGLLVLPGGNGTSSSVVSAAVPERPVRDAATAVTPSASGAARTLYSPARGMPDGGKADPSGAGSVTASPMTPAAALLAIEHLTTPHVDLASPSGFGPAWIFVAAGAMAVSLAGIVVWHRRQMRRLS